MSIEVFFSYSHKDENLRDELADHLSVLEQSGIITSWHDRRIEPGAEWANQIEDRLRTADIVLFLVSASFLASQYCYNTEMPVALERHAQKKAQIIPIILRPCGWENAPFSHIQAVPTKKQRGIKPVTSDAWRDHDEAFLVVEQGIRRAVNTLLERRRHENRERDSHIYRSLVQDCLEDDCNLSPIERIRLDHEAQCLILSLAERNQIEGDEQRQCQERESNRETFEIACRNATQQKGLISEKIEGELRLLGQSLKLSQSEIDLKIAEIRQHESERSILEPIQPPTSKNFLLTILSQWKLAFRQLKRTIGQQNLIFLGVILTITVMFLLALTIHKQEIAKLQQAIIFEEKASISSSDPVKYYEDKLTDNRNDPSSLIYKNNAFIRQNNKRSYTVVVSVPSTKNSDRALEMLRGFAQVQDEINRQGGIPGTNGGLLRLGIIDDEDDSNKAKAIAEAAIGDEKVLAVAGHWSAPTSEPAMEVYNHAKKLVFITPITITKDSFKSTPYSFRVNASSDEGGKALGDYVLKELQNKTRAIVFYDGTNDYTKNLRDKFASVIETKIKDIQKIDLLTLSEGGIEATLKDLDPKETVLAIFPADDSTNTALDIIKNADQKFALIGDMANLYARKTLAVSQSNGMILAPSWHFDDSIRGAESSFSCSSLNLWGDQVNWATAMSYNAAQALVAAMSPEESGEEPSRSSIQRTLLSKLLIEGVSGYWTFNQDTGKSNIGVRLVKIVLAEESRPYRSREKYDFIPIDRNSYNVELSQGECKPEGA